MEKKLILVVEDDTDVAGMMISMLREVDGYDYQIVTSSNAALEAVEAVEFDVLLTDLGLPAEEDKPHEVDPFAGFEVARRIKEKCPDIMVIFCTGLDPTSFWEKLPPDLSSARLLSKPFGFKAFCNIFN